MHIDAEFALRDTDRCDSKKMLHDPTNDNFSGFFFFVFCFVLLFFVFCFFSLYQQEKLEIG